jgi:hypothetical protein
VAARTPGHPCRVGGLGERQLEQFQRLGLEPEAFGPKRVAIRQAPAPLRDRDDLPDALLELSLGGDLTSAQVAIACRTAIRNGTPLTPRAMQTLLDDWQQTRNPRTCPHGRPICLTLSETSLARFSVAIGWLAKATVSRREQNPGFSSLQLQTPGDHPAEPGFFAPTPRSLLGLGPGGGA